MNEIARRWRLLAGGAAAGMAAVVGFAGSTASAEPVLPQPPLPMPATVTQTVTVAPNAVAPQMLGQPAVAPATAASAGGISVPAVPAPPPVTITPAASGTLADFFKAKGVKLEPQNSRDFKALNIVLPMPKGWSQVPDPNVPDAYAVIADRAGGNGLYSTNAQVVVYKPLADFGGMPSSVIEGTYRDNSMTLNTSRRHVIATVGPDKYLVSLSVTTSVDQVVASADATDAIVNGFKVSAPTSPTPAPSPAAPGLPQSPSQLGSPAVPQLLGQPG